MLIPIQCEFYALEGVSQLVSTIDLVKKSLNPELEIQGVILSMFDGRTNLSAQVVQEVKKCFGDKVYTTVIPRNVRLAEAPSYGLPITAYDPKSKGAEAYMDFAQRISGIGGRIMAATKKGGLGRGLDALFADVPVRISSDDGGNKKDPAEDKDSVIYIKVHDITPNANQPRKVFNEEKLEELAASIRQNGIIQPIVVRKRSRGYEIVAGER